MGLFTRARGTGDADAAATSSGVKRDEDEAVRKYTFVTLERVLAGAMAGGISRVVTAPIDRVKLLYQVDRESGRFTLRSGIAMARDIVRNEGFFALWRGCNAAVLRILPYSATTFGTFNAYNSALASTFGVEADNDAVRKHRGEDERSPPVGDMRTRFVAGAMAGATATIVTYPLDLLHAAGGALAMHPRRIFQACSGALGIFTT